MKKLDIWPALPINIAVCHRYYQNNKNVDNLIAVIKHNERVCKLDIPSFSDIAAGRSCVGDVGAIPGINRSDACLPSQRQSGGDS